MGVFDESEEMAVGSGSGAGLSLEERHQQKILEMHLAWLESRPEGMRANLTRSTLSGVNWQRANLTRAVLTATTWVERISP